MKGKKDDLTYSNKRNNPRIIISTTSWIHKRMISYLNKKWNPEIRIPSLLRLINRCLKILIFNRGKIKTAADFHK